MEKILTEKSVLSENGQTFYWVSHTNKEVTIVFLPGLTANHVLIFCNKRRNAIKVLRYDRNGFVLATKKLFYYSLLTSCKLNSYLHEIDE